jgi:hypothetical protein
MTTINNETAGALERTQSSEMWKKTVDLKVTGQLNYDDWKFIGSLKRYNNLSIIDLEHTEGLTMPEDLSFPFAKFSSLESIALPEGIDRISTCEFEYCTNLQYVKLPENISCIGEMAFEGCISLTRINLPNNLKKIEDCAFAGCASLDNINLSAHIESIEQLHLQTAPH